MLLFTTQDSKAQADKQQDDIISKSASEADQQPLPSAQQEQEQARQLEQSTTQQAELPSVTSNRPAAVVSDVQALAATPAASPAAPSNVTKQDAPAAEAPVGSTTPAAPTHGVSPTAAAGTTASGSQGKNAFGALMAAAKGKPSSSTSTGHKAATAQEVQLQADR